MDWSDWALTLSRGVSGDKVDYGKLLEGRQSLDRFLASISRVGPRTNGPLFPTKEDRLAYAINCYNAVIVASVLELGHGHKPPAYLPIDFEQRFRFRVDGDLRSPADLRREALALAGDDWRVLFAMCGAASPGPPLSRWPLQGDMLDGQLNEITKAALESPQVVQVAHGEEKRLLVWGGLLRLKDRLIGDYERRTGGMDATLLSVLLEWSNATRRGELNSAVGYQVAAMPTTGALNSVEPPPPQKGLFSGLRSISFIRPQ